MEVAHHSVDDVVVVTLTGEIDGKTAPAAQQQIVPLIPEAGKIVLDMSAVGYMSSAGLRMLLLLYRNALGQDSKIALVGLAETISDTMDATGFLDFFVVGDTVEAGLDLLGAES